MLPALFACSFFSCTWPATLFLFFFFNDTATTEIYTLSLHDALPICTSSQPVLLPRRRLDGPAPHRPRVGVGRAGSRSEEHTSELQSRLHLVCRLLLEKKKKAKTHTARNNISVPQLTPSSTLDHPYVD